MNSKQIFALAAALAAASLVRSCASGDPSAFAAASLLIGNNAFTVDVADTAPKRNLGLMHRESLAPDAGMLFVFPTPQKPCFWMKNTLVPLTVAFVASSGHIVSVADMFPRSLENHCSPVPVSYAVEVAKGALTVSDIGQTVLGLPK